LVIKSRKFISGGNGLRYLQRKVAGLGGTSFKSNGHLQPTLDTSSSPRTLGEQLFSSWRPKNNRYLAIKSRKYIFGANGLSYSQRKVAGLGGTSFKSNGHLQPTLDASSSPRTPGEQLFSSWRRKKNGFWRQKYPKSISGANGLSYSQMKVARLGGTSIKSIGHLQPTLDTSSSPRTPGEQLFSSWRPKNNRFWRQKYPKFISGANGLSYSQRKVAGLGGTSFKSNGHLQPALDASSSPRTLGEQLENTRCRM
jgi:hypothetical protein